MILFRIIVGEDKNFMKNQSLAYKYALISVLFWSTVATAFKVTLEFLNPVSLLFYSSVVSLIILGAILYKEKKLNIAFLHIKNKPILSLILGAINPFLYYLILFNAYEILPAQEAQAINYTWALMFAYLSVIFLKNKLTKADIIAGFICYFGVLIIATKGHPFSLEFSSTLGVILAITSTILWAIYWIINSKSKIDATVGLFCNFFIGVFLIGFYLMFTKELQIPNLKATFGVIYIGLFEMGITFVFWLKAVNYTHSISKISNLIFLSPFLSLVFIHFFVGEEILLSTIIALILIILGLVIQQRKSRLG
jgi:drug/metabolite transporter (DMT)-like permease